MGYLAGCESLETGPEEWCGSTHWRCAPLPTSCKQQDGKAQAEFGFVTIPLLDKQGETPVPAPKQYRAEWRDSPSGLPTALTRETTLVLTKPGPSRSSAEIWFFQLTQPTWTFPFNCTEMLGRLSPKPRTFPVSFPTHLSLKFPLEKMNPDLSPPVR